MPVQGSKGCLLHILICGFHLMKTVLQIKLQKVSSPSQMIETVLHQRKGVSIALDNLINFSVIHTEIQLTTCILSNQEW